ncbi:MULTISPECIES: hypothetical protein [Protofrankia]|uniref:Uncharacterized protein n=2 Tax=Protofrankia TaxID=2994361 RepID=F8AZ64_9ACTN|nr:MULTISPECIES: hypothetical protein [Protofrankia]AEH10531.1 hypothetical protein FsymDg_3225 [Candidatus Protofrankia datiscae]KLL10004.1 hypothetical protein FrCorBMG51_20955 [Protofrankia coriariae]
MILLKSLLTAAEELTLLLLPHGGQRTARRNAWRAAADLQVGAGRHGEPSWKVVRAVPPTAGRVAIATER